MFADPQTVHIFGVDNAFPRVGSANPARLGVFKSSDGLVELDIRQDTSAKRQRHEVRITRQKIAADPISAVNQQVSASAIFVVDQPKFGFSDSDLDELIESIKSWLTSGNKIALRGGQL